MGGPGKFGQIRRIERSAGLACLELCDYLGSRLRYLQKKLTVLFGFDEAVVLAVLLLALEGRKRKIAGTLIRCIELQIG